MGRSYELFAFLADVRNSRDLKPIASPKGVPNNASPEYKKEVDFMNGDGHSHSWFTLEELKNADWDQVVTMSGVVPADVYEYLKENKESPKSYCSMIMGPNIVTLSEEEWANLAWKEKSDSVIRYYVGMEWKKLIKELVDSFYTETLERLDLLGPPDSVRIVFFFDN